VINSNVGGKGQKVVIFFLLLFLFHPLTCHRFLLLLLLTCHLGRYLLSEAVHLRIFNDPPRSLQ